MGWRGEALVVFTICLLLYVPLLLYLTLAGTYIADLVQDNVSISSFVVSPTAVKIILSILLFPLCSLKDFSKLGSVSGIGLGLMIIMVSATNRR